MAALHHRLHQPGTRMIFGVRWIGLVLGQRMGKIQIYRFRVLEIRLLNVAFMVVFLVILYGV